MAANAFSCQTLPGYVVHSFYAAMHAGVYAHSDQPSYQEVRDTLDQANEPGLLCCLVPSFDNTVCLPRLL